MAERKKRQVGDTVQLIAIFVFCGVAVLFDFVKIQYSSDEFINRMIAKIVQQCCGSIAAIVLMVRLKIKLFGVPQGWLYFIPCLIIALDNFPLISYLNGNMQIVRNSALEVTLFAGYCLSVGLFEELIFRGVIFSVVAGYFNKNKNGFITTYIVSSVIFGGIHIFNIIAGAGVGATVLQVGYSTLTGALFAFALIKMKNIFIPAFLHGLYNFCGLFCTKEGLGMGSFFDTGTIIMMAVISVLIGLFVLYSVLTYKEEDRVDLYKKLGIRPIEKEKVAHNTDETNA